MALQGSAPPGWEKSVERMKERPEIENPFALAWWLHHQGYAAEDLAQDAAKLKQACDDYDAACRGGQVDRQTVELAASGVAWAQAVCLGRRLGRPYHVYREPAW